MPRVRMTSQQGELGKQTHLDTFLRLFLQVLKLLGNLPDDSGGQRLCSLKFKRSSRAGSIQRFEIKIVQERQQ